MKLGGRKFPQSAIRLTSRDGMGQGFIMGGRWRGKDARCQLLGSHDKDDKTV